MLFKELTREEDLEISRLDGYDAGLRQYSRFVEIVRSYGHIDQLTGAVMVKIMEAVQKGRRPHRIYGALRNGVD